MSRVASNIRILVTGSSGQLGSALIQESQRFKELDFIFLDRNALDITSSVSISEVMDVYSPDFIINTAAYTAVDAAESNQDQAAAINQIAVGHLAVACKNRGIGLIHISTDYIFDGKNKEAYQEDDMPHPKTVYGRSKLAGEKAILNAKLEAFAIVRTSWVYSVYGTNFVKTMLRLGRKKDSLSVVDDQIGSPTYANDLAIALIEISKKLTSENSGVYHYCNSGITSWYAFAKAVFTYSNIAIELKPISTENYPTAAVRPLNSVLNCDKIKGAFNLEIPQWEDSLKRMISSYDVK